LRSNPYTGVYILENTPPPRGGGNMVPEPMGGKNMKNYAHAAKAKKGKEERKRMRRKIKGEKEREIAN